jgi:predicted transcriptional regulator
MQRNPKNPRAYNNEPRKRASEKITTILDMLVQFHHSTRELLLLRLGLNINSHHAYFKNLENKGIIRRVAVFSIKSRFVYMLTPLGKEMAAEKMLDNVINYSIDITKINHSSLRHDLAVQKAVIERLKEYDKFTAEKYLPNLIFFDKKKPDACLEKNDEKTMFEIELTAKSDQRIFRAFTSHAQALINLNYHKVKYIFQSETLKNYYLERFNQEFWPIYQQNQRGIWVKQGDLNPNNHENLRDCFDFIADTSLLKNI